MNKSLNKLEKILNKYNETLKVNKDEYKTTPSTFESIQKAWKCAFDEDRIEIIKCIDGK